ncbi:MAG: hypothetical protein JO176_04005 [Acidimicrobiia bacterium]|nr:hypothetical protein [Acidimicrobiia bacterium]
MGVDASAMDWQEEGKRHLRERLGRDLAIFVVDHVNVELHATADAEGLYRSLGFWEGHGGKALRRRRWDPPSD